MSFIIPKLIQAVGQLSLHKWCVVECMGKGWTQFLQFLAIKVKEKEGISEMSLGNMVGKINVMKWTSQKKEKKLEMKCHTYKGVWLKFFYKFYVYKK